MKKTFFKIEKNFQNNKNKIFQNREQKVKKKLGCKQKENCFLKYNRKHFSKGEKNIFE